MGLIFPQKSPRFLYTGDRDHFGRAADEGRRAQAFASYSREGEAVEFGLNPGVYGRELTCGGGGVRERRRAEKNACDFFARDLPECWPW